MAPIKRSNLHKSSGAHDDGPAVTSHRRLAPTEHRGTGGTHDAAAAGSPAINATPTNSAPAAAQRRKAHLMLQVRKSADLSVSQAAALKTVITDVANEIANSILAIGRTNERHEASIRMMQELELQAATIGQMVKAVALIADQTNRLTLNNLIDAAHANVHANGHSKDTTTITDPWRTPIAATEANPGDIQALMVRIQQDVKLIAEGIQGNATAAREELVRGKQTADVLSQIHTNMSGVIAAATEEQTSAIEEINRAAAEITTALDQCRCTAYSCE